MSDVQRLSRLLIAACLAYIWIVYLGSVCEKEQWRPIMHRRKRCDVSLFQLGLRLLEHLLNQYCGQNLGCLIGNDAIVTKRFVIRAGFFHTLPVG